MHLILYLCILLDQILPKNLVRPLEISSGRFIHLTDLHIDPFYVQGSSSNTGCHRFISLQEEEKTRAGPFGHRKCDCPIKTAKYLLSHVRDHVIDFDFILLTGDLARHDNDPIYRPKTLAEVKTANLLVRSALTTYFPTKPVVFCIGNNDLHEHDQLAENSETLKALFMVWRHYIPRDQWETFATSGYYQISGYYYPLDIVVLNTQFFYEANKQVDDCSVKGSAGHKHLKWLKKQLKISEKRGASVYIVGHVSPATGQYYPSCRKAFEKLTKKYSKTIEAQLFGHSNYDEFSVAGGKKKGTFSLVAPPVVPLFNPAFRIFDYYLGIKNFGRLLDYHQYYMDLDDANATGRPKVQHEYSAQDTYGPGPLTYKYYRHLKSRLGLESVLRERYELYRVVNCVECLKEE